MSVASRRPRGHSARALEEALGAVAAPAVRDAVMGSALSRAGLVTIPDDGPALDDFVRGAFSAAVRDRLGDDAAEVVLAELWPMLALMIARTRPRSTARPKAPSVVPEARTTSRPVASSVNAAPTAPPPALEDDDPSGVFVGAGKTCRAGDSLPVIVAIVSDATRAKELSRALAGKALVRPVNDLIELSEAVEDHRSDHPVVLFDCTRPPFHLESVATFASELPSGSWLALLDASPDHTRTARSFAGSTLTVATLRSANGIDELARSCVKLFG